MARAKVTFRSSKFKKLEERIRVVAAEAAVDRWKKAALDQRRRAKSRTGAKHVWGRLAAMISYSISPTGIITIRSPHRATWMKEKGGVITAGTGPFAKPSAYTGKMAEYIPIPLSGTVAREKSITHDFKQYRFDAKARIGKGQRNPLKLIFIPLSGRKAAASAILAHHEDKQERKQAWLKAHRYSEAYRARVFEERASAFENSPQGQRVSRTIATVEAAIGRHKAIARHQGTPFGDAQKHGAVAPGESGVVGHMVGNKFVALFLFVHAAYIPGQKWMPSRRATMTACNKAVRALGGNV